MEHHILGFPRIGGNRELKKAQEAFWRNSATQEELLAVSRTLTERHWAIQAQAGLSLVCTGDFSLYDQMLDTTCMLGAVPDRFASAHITGLDLYFAMARGDAARNITAMEMTKWFNTNYHFLVPELPATPTYRLTDPPVVKDTRRASSLGYRPKPVLIGPITWLALAKPADSTTDRWEHLDAVLDVYTQVLAELDPLCPWIQMDEPILCADMDAAARGAFSRAYAHLNTSVRRSRLLLTTYFDTLDDNRDIALHSGCAGLHISVTGGAHPARTSDTASLHECIAALPDTMTLSVGIVEGRNIWKTDFAHALRLLEHARPLLEADRLMVGSACSLLHCPVDLDQETTLDPELKRWMSFAVQKCAEVGTLGTALSCPTSPGCGQALRANAADILSRRESSRVHDAHVTVRSASVQEAMAHRNSPYALRRQAQRWLELPLFPTTTIGSFPQTAEIRARRREFRAGTLSHEAYTTFLQDEIAHVVHLQEELGLDVLVHGEPERNDMVEYFGQQLQGFCFTSNGWVQSYGSRCVKPPIIFGDISRPSPMTVDWIRYAASLTDKPMKGMLTGPVTILCWSFVRDDMERAAVCRQIALALRDEVADLEAAGIRLIQVDEAAFSEGMPIKRRDREAYLKWAVESFRLTTCGVDDTTQIHSHMCYSEFNEIIHAIADMDADVISIESSRSGMELLEAFRAFAYPNAIGPGIYDIHSPRVPDIQEMVDLLERALRFIPKERLWVNPDCGLKTRNWPETLASLRNMVSAAQRLRTQHT